MRWIKNLFGSEEPMVKVAASTPTPEPPLEPSAPAPDPLPEPKPEPVWEKRVSSYALRIVCHCGSVMRDHTLSTAMGALCPKCGCTDKYREEIGRMEWEFSRDYTPSRFEISRYAESPWNWRNARNAKWVKKPNECPHKGDE